MKIDIEGFNKDLEKIFNSELCTTLLKKSECRKCLITKIKIAIEVNTK